MIHNQKFLELVEQYCLAHNCSKSDAMKAVIKKDPEVHQAFLQHHNPGMILDTDAGSNQKHTDPDKGDFLRLVDEYKNLHGCSTTDAILAVVKQNPGAHKAYMERCNPGKKFS